MNFKSFDSSSGFRKILMTDATIYFESIISDSYLGTIQTGVLCRAELNYWAMKKFQILLSWTYVIQNSVLFQKMYGSYLEKLKIESNLDFYYISTFGCANLKCANLDTSENE